MKGFEELKERRGLGRRPAQRFLLALVLCLGLFAAAGAAGEQAAGGTWGTCPWTLDDAGLLTVGAGTGGGMKAAVGRT